MSSRGGFRLREAGAAGDDLVVIADLRRDRARGARGRATCSARDEGVEAVVLCLSSPDRLYRDWQAATHRAAPPRAAGCERTSRRASPRRRERGLPVVTVIDGSSHALSFLGSALGTRCVPLGVDRFGQTGSQPELYSAYGIDAAAIATAALIALEP